jgi:malate dehydrogenase (oxaloacetate-decarboxylating)
VEAIKHPENWLERYNAALVATVRVRLDDRPGELARVFDLLGRAAAPIGDVRIVAVDSTTKTRDVQVFCVDREHFDRVRAVIDEAGVEILSVTNEVLEIHRGGAIETKARVPLDTVTELRMVYTPGVASVCQLIAEDPEMAWEYTHKGNRIAIVTNGTAVLGLGNIGALAGLPVMEGKAAILAKFVGVSADPVLIDSEDPKEIISIVEKIASNYGAIQLEDIGSPACFEIEEELDRRLDIPVFHDDQHGTATVALAGLINALRETGRTPAETSAVVLGAGAAGLAIARFLVDFGLGDVVLCDSRGAVHRGRTDGMNEWKQRLAEATNKDNVSGSLEEVMRGRDLFVGVSKPNLVTADMVRSMADKAIVFALANPISEISVGEAKAAGAAVALDGRGMNNALAYPGIFKGALMARARRISHEMRVAAARALADHAAQGHLMPEMLDLSVHEAVANAVARVGVEQRPPAAAP